MQSLREQQTGELVGHFLALELGRGLSGIPVINTKLSHIDSQSFCGERASRDCTIRSVNSTILPMTFEQDTGIDVIKLLNTGIVDIGNDTIKDELEVLQIVQGGDAIKIVNVLLNRFQNLLGFRICQRGNLCARFTNIKNMAILRGEIRRRELQTKAVRFSF